MSFNGTLTEQFRSNQGGLYNTWSFKSGQKLLRRQPLRQFHVLAFAAQPGGKKGNSLDVGGVAKEELQQGPSRRAPAKPGRSLDLGGVAKEEAQQNGASLSRPPQRSSNSGGRGQGSSSSGGRGQGSRPPQRPNYSQGQRPGGPQGQRSGGQSRPRPSGPPSQPQNQPVLSRKREAALEASGSDKTEGIVMNEAIRYPEVRVLDAKKDAIGVMSTAEALQMAMEQDVDLILINPDAQPPLVRLAPLSKLKYEQKQKEKDQRKKQRESRQDVKELRFRPNTEEHDYNVRLNHAKRHLSKGDKVKLTMRFKGREMEYQGLGREMFTRFLNELGDAATVQSNPKMAGNQMTLLIGPKAAK